MILVQGDINGATGGRLVVSDASSNWYGTSIDFPPGAFSGTKTIAIEDATTPPLQSGLVAIGPAIVLRPMGLRLSVRATLKLPLSRTHFNSLPLNQHWIVLLAFDPTIPEGPIGIPEGPIGIPEGPIGVRTITTSTPQTVNGLTLYDNSSNPGGYDRLAKYDINELSGFLVGASDQGQAP